MKTFKIILSALLFLAIAFVAPAQALTTELHISAQVINWSYYGQRNFTECAITSSHLKPGASWNFYNLSCANEENPTLVADTDYTPSSPQVENLQVFDESTGTLNILNWDGNDNCFLTQDDTETNVLANGTTVSLRMLTFECHPDMRYTRPVRPNKGK